MIINRNAKGVHIVVIAGTYDNGLPRTWDIYLN